MELNFEVYGERREGVLPLVVLHGWANSVDVIRPLASALGAYTEVFSIDLPGHGKSPVPDSVYGMEDFANALKSFLVAKELSEVYLLGHSFGGKTIIKFSALYPDYAKKIVLIGASGLRPRPSLKKRVKFLLLKYLRAAIRFKNTRLGKRIYEEWYIPQFASRDYNNAGPMLKTFVKTINEELHEELSLIKVPALLLWGDRDDESPPSVGAEMESLIEDSRLILLPNQDHYPFLGGGAPLVVKYVRDFLFK